MNQDKLLIVGNSLVVTLQELGEAKETLRKTQYEFIQAKKALDD